MRKLIFATIALLLMVTPAVAQQAKLECFPGDRTFLAESLAAIDAGRVKGAYLTGAKLKPLRAEIGLSPAVVAVILFEHEGKRLFAFAIAHDGDAILGCFGVATPKGIEIFNRHYSGRGV
jgi:hypothetical protein